MNAVTIVLLIAVALAAGFAIRSIRKSKTAGCGGSCANCPGCCSEK